MDDHVKAECGKDRDKHTFTHSLVQSIDSGEGEKKEKGSLKDMSEVLLKEV